ncbi:MAG: PSD1 and planctomycete cytochrome C domain-containing protein [Pirellulales bacterium]
MSSRRFRSAVLSISCCLCWLLAGGVLAVGEASGETSGEATAGDANAAAAEAAPLNFARDIRPILSGACFQCHGPDETHREADLRLDTREGLLADRDGAKPFVPGDPAASAALERITSADPAERMPPAESGKSLTPAQIDKLRQWVVQGAEYSEHWAFVPPVRPPLPAVQDSSSVRNLIDMFVIARLEQAGLSPQPEADRVTLLRRLSLDLIGLPPTIEEVDAFVNDSDPAAYEKQVERLLASPHYGERWGRHWLDAARYADSDGYEKDKPRFVWFYRDWVVQAFNRDLPYDQFIIEQVAGDLLPGATQDQHVATGYLRNSMINEEGGIDPEQFRMEAMFDRLDCLGKGVLGLTIQCAQCHTHKFDPLAQRDYYRMFACLNNCHEANITVYTPEEQTRRQAILEQIAAIEARLQAAAPDWPRRLAAWESSVAGDQPAWQVVRPEIEEISAGGQKYQLQEDGSLLACGYAPTKHRAQFTIRTDLQGITAFRLELLNDPNLPHGGPGRSIQGTCALTEFEVDAAPADGSAGATRVKIAAATADVSPAEAPLLPYYDDRSKKRRVTGPIEMAIDGNGDTAWGIDVGAPRRNEPRKAVFRAEAPIGFAGGTVLTFYLNQNHGGWNSDDNQNHNLGRFRLSITTAPDVVADPVPRRVREILEVPAGERSPEQIATVFSYWRTTVPEWSEANAEIEALWGEHPDGTTQLTLVERGASRETHRLERGDFLKPAEAVEPGVPDFLNDWPASDEPPRLALARWLVDRQAPTTARAFVNRIWQAYFGTGLVATSEDLGSQCEPPSHPALLDWLAVEFMDSGWSVKQMHRLIATSATYRRSSQVTPELLARDPFNRLLARGPRQRVEGEVVRDVALAASGLLNPELGGPSVHPPAPAFLFEPPASYGPKVWIEDTGPNRYRRSLYTFQFRSIPFPMLQTFDAPNGDSACVRRVKSNTPLQALTTLNEPLFVECARALALRTVREGGATDDERMTFAFRCCVARRPSDDEVALLTALLDKQTERFTADGARPWLLATSDPEHPPELPAGVTPAQLAGWTAVARVLLNLDETITKP